MIDPDLLSDIRDSLQNLEAELLTYETSLGSNGDGRESIHLLLRRAHSLKGTLQLAERPRCATLIHAVESLLTTSRNQNQPVPRDALNATFDALDSIAANLTLINENSSILDRITRQIVSLSPPRPAASTSPAVSSPPFPFPKLTQMELARVAESKSKGFQLFAVEKAIRSDLDRSTFENLPIFEDIRAAGSLIAVRPAYDSIDKKKREIIITIWAATAQSDEQLGMIVFDPYRWCQRWEDWPTSQAPSIATSAVEVAKIPEITSPRRILIAEDEFTSRTILLAMLRNYGNCAVAVDGREAIQAIHDSIESNTPYSLICLDIMMPHNDGIAVLQALRLAETTARAKTVITTSLSSYDDLHRAFDAGCDGYVVKPITKTALVRQLGRIGIYPMT